MKIKEISEAYVNILKNLSGEQRIKEGMELYEFAMNIAKSSIKKENPNISSREMDLKLKNRIPR